MKMEAIQRRAEKRDDCEDHAHAHADRKTKFSERIGNASWPPPLEPPTSFETWGTSIIQRQGKKVEGIHFPGPDRSPL